MSHSKFVQFLIDLGYSEKDINPNLEEDTFSYLKPIATEQYYENDICLKYMYIPADKLNTTLFEKHTDLWNENKEYAFVVISEDTTYLLNAKVKPNIINPLNNSVIIENFSYGINSEGFAPEELNRLKKTIGKDSVDSAYFFDFIIEKTKRRKTSEVDKDLLLNLIQLRNDLLKVQNAQETIHLLILRSLFIKYLEDRGIYGKDYLVNILKTGSAQKLVNAFEEIKKINGDIFKSDEFAPNDIHNFLGKLETFFSCFDYRTNQHTLFFPYKFDKIPIQLISHVYEAFLSNAHKGNKGIFYTPALVVRFMLSHTVHVKLQEKKEITVLDPACGSGAFLVEAFKEIVRSNNAENDYDKKVDILKKQIFGIDIDKQALQIAAFSLYLSLLEGEKPESIQKKIKDSFPILPSLIDHSLTIGNSLLDNNIYSDMTFDCVVANPPWVSAPKTGDEEDKRERKAIAQKGKIGVLSQGDKDTTFPEYRNVSDYQRSQAFLLRVNKWCTKETLCSLIVNSPIFLNEKADGFRKELLTLYRITHFYELSHLNEILFKKQVIGEIKNNNHTEKIEIGSSEPCAIIVFDKKESHSHEIPYVSPKLTMFSKSFELIHYTNKDVTIVKQEDLLKEDDWLWRIFVNGSWSDYQIIKQKYIGKNDSIELKCHVGFKPIENGEIHGKPLYRKLISPDNFEQYYIYKNLKLFNWNRKFERNPEKEQPNIFQGKRILIPRKPLETDKIRLRGVRVNGDIVHKDNILCIKITRNNKSISDYAPYLAILNSAFMGYYLYHISSQWGKGEEKRSALRNSDIENLPFPQMQRFDEKASTLTKLVEQIEADKKEHKDRSKLERKIDEMVFGLYDLLEYERETIREFYQVNVDRKGHNATENDFQQYVNKFREVFSFILAEHLALNATYRKSSNLGAYIAFAIVKKDEMIPEIELDLAEDRQLLDIVKKKQLSQTLFSHRLNEDKVKIYTENKFFIIKSNYFKDWTPRQAMIDANEEIGSILKELPKK